MAQTSKNIGKVEAGQSRLPATCQLKGTQIDLIREISEFDIKYMINSNAYRRSFSPGSTHYFTRHLNLYQSFVLDTMAMLFAYKPSRGLRVLKSNASALDWKTDYMHYSMTSQTTASLQLRYKDQQFTTSYDITGMSPNGTEYWQYWERCVSWWSPRPSLAGWGLSFTVDQFPGATSMTAMYIRNYIVRSFTVIYKPPSDDAFIRFSIIGCIVYCIEHSARHEVIHWHCRTKIIHLIHIS